MPPRGLQFGDVLPFYQWQAKFGSMEAGNAKRLRELDAENNRHKKLLPEAVLDKEALKVAFGVKRRAHRRSDARWAQCWKRARPVNGALAPWWACCATAGDTSPCGRGVTRPGARASWS